MIKRNYLRFELLLLVIFILSVTINCFAQYNNSKKLILKECIKITLENSLDLKSVQEDINLSENMVSQAKTNGYPGVNVTTYYTRNDPLKTVDVGGKQTQLGVQNQTQGLFTFNYPLYDGSYTSNLVDQKILINEATFCDKEAVRQNSIYKAIESYYNVLRSYNFLDVAQKTLATTQEQYNISDGYYREGVVAKADVLSAKAQLSNSEIGIIKAQKNILMTQSTLNDTMGLPLDSDFQLIDNLVFFNAPVDLNYITELSYENRAEVKKMLLLINAAEKTIDVARSQRLPTLSFNFNYIFYSTTLSTPSNSISATLNANIPIFDRGLTICRIDEAEVYLRQAKINLEQVKKSLALEVKHAYLNFQESEKTVEKIRTTLEYARQNYRVTRMRYQEGIAPFIEISNAQVVLTQAEVDNVIALYDFYIAKASMIKSMGFLPEDGNLDNIKLVKEEETGKGLKIDNPAEIKNEIHNR